MASASAPCLVPHPPRRSSLLQPKSSFHSSCSDVTAAFPLPASTIDAPTLSSSVIESLLAQAAESFAALQTRCLGPQDRWTPLAHSRKVHVTSGVATAPPGASVLSYAKIYATLDEILGLKDNTTQSIQHFSDSVLDSKVLYTLLEDSDRAVVVRWQALAFGLPVQNRDVVLLETQREFECPDGRRGFGFAQHSITLPCCHDLYEPYQLVRATLLHSGMLFFESDVDGQLDVYCHTELDFKGSVPSWLAVHLLRKRAFRELTTLSTFLHERRLTKRIQYQYVVMVPKIDRTHCCHCLYRFYSWLRKCNCKVCGEVFCWRCTQLWRLESQPTRVCVGCARDFTSDPTGQQHPTILDSTIQGFFPILRQRASTTAGLRKPRKTGSMPASFDDKRSTENESDDVDWAGTMTSNLAVLGDTGPLLEVREKTLSVGTNRPSRSKSAFYVW